MTDPVSTEGLDHALHYDPSCEECVYLARPVVLRSESDRGIDVRRVTQAIANVAARHGVAKDPPPDLSLMRIYGYSAATPDMDAELAAEYVRLSTPETSE